MVKASVSREVDPEFDFRFRGGIFLGSHTSDLSDYRQQPGVKGSASGLVGRVSVTG